MATRTQKRLREGSSYEQTDRKHKRLKKGTKGSSNLSLKKAKKGNRLRTAGQRRRKPFSGISVEVQSVEEVHLVVVEEDISEEDDLQIQEVLMQNTGNIKMTSTEPSDEALGNSNNEDDSQEWLSAYIKKSNEERREELVKPSTEERSEKFQRYFLNKLSLKPEVVSTLVRIKGVQGVGWGFSRSAEGQEPVIQIMPMNYSADASLVEDVASEIQGYISETYKEECKIEEIRGYVEISKGQESPEDVKIFQSKPGDEVHTVYHSLLTPRKITGCLTGFVYTQLKVETNDWSFKYDAHFPILPFHCILPTECELFRARLPEVLEDKPGKLHIEIYSENVCEGVPLVRGNGPLSHQMPTLLKATAFPKITSESIGTMERQGILTSTTVRSRDSLQGFLTGKAGLIGKKDDKYVPVIIRNLMYTRPPVPFCTHPCTVDVAACKTHAVEQCSFTDALDSPNGIQIPSNVRDLTGEVSMLKNGRFITLARNGLSDVEFHTANGLSFQCFKWTNDDPFIEQRYTMSGSPAFINQGESRFFLGGLYTPETAFNSDFALEIIRPEICDYFISDTIENVERRRDKERNAAKKTRLIQVVKHMKKFHQRIVTLKDYQVTAWCNEISLAELYGNPQDHKGTIKCKVEYCIDRHAVVTRR